MIESLKEIIGIIEKLPHLALWILAGLLLYKIIVIGSWFGIAKLLIERAHSFAMRPAQPKEMLLGDMLCQVPESRLRAALRLIPRGNLSYLHDTHVSWLEHAILEKREADRLKQSTKPTEGDAR